jgi:hypothetical protein
MQVKIFLRRIGLRQYLSAFHAYGVDGRVLCLLDKEDYDNMKIFNKVHIRKIKVELAKIFMPKDKIYKSDMHEYRRETIKRIKAQEAAAIIIQKYFRRFAARKEVKLRLGLLLTQKNLEAMESALLAMGAWYTDREDIPSKQLVLRDTDDDVMASGNAKKTTADFLQNIRFPPIKTFGKRQDYLSTSGWGRRQPNGSWLPLLAAAPANTKTKPFTGDAHPTRIFSDRLSERGYDNRRLCAFHGHKTIKLEDTIEHREIAVQTVAPRTKKAAANFDELSLAGGSQVSTFSYHSDLKKNSVELNPLLDVLL